MLDDELGSRIGTELRQELAGLQPRPDLLESLRRRQARRSLTLKAGFAAVPVTAGAVAVAVAAGSQGTVVPQPTVLTAALIHQVTSASRHAIAHSGRATIAYRQRLDGKLQVSGLDTVTYSDENWNDVISQRFPAVNGQPAHVQGAIDRIVNGQFYLGDQDKNGRVRWIHEVQASGHPATQVPDPRTVLSVLKPSAKFTVVGHKTVGGVRLTELRARKPGQVTAVPDLLDQGPGRISYLTVWIDQHHVVHQLTVRNGKANSDGTPVTMVTVTFTKIGMRQVITAPRHAVSVVSKG